MIPFTALSTRNRLAQSQLQEENVEQAAHEMSKPLARYKDDLDLDDQLKAVEREGDTMLAFLSKSKAKARAKRKGMYCTIISRHFYIPYQ